MIVTRTNNGYNIECGHIEMTQITYGLRLNESWTKNYRPICHDRRDKVTLLQKMLKAIERAKDDHNFDTIQATDKEQTLNEQTQNNHGP